MICVAWICIGDGKSEELDTARERIATDMQKLLMELKK
jgi:hypothetical protein